MSKSPTRKSSQAAIDRATAWNLAHPERHKAIALKSYLKYRPPLKPVLTIHQRFDRLYIPVPESGCWLWLGSVDKDGYGKVKVERKYLRAHRWAWKLFRGSIPESIEVLHSCDVPTCVNPEHLFLGTNQDNVDDRERKGRSYVLPVYRNLKISESDAREIRNLRGSVKQVELGARFCIHPSQISRIQRNPYWEYLDAPKG